MFIRFGYLHILILCTYFIQGANVLNAQEANDPSLTDLENVRNQITEVQLSIDKARKESDLIIKEVQTSEMMISEMSLNLESINDQIILSQEKILQLNLDKTNQEEDLEKERALLASQVRSAYHTGRNDYIKLLLNQEDPELVGRLMTYYDYFNDARARRINIINKTLNDLEQLARSIDQESNSLQALKVKEENSLSELLKSRQQRQALIERLNIFINEQDNQLAILTQDAEQLESLINNLKTQDSIVQTFENIPPFVSLKGQLSWPVTGKINNKFGATRKDGKLRWQGINILAEKGTIVKAISQGKVVFADWFRNMGLLIIIDHGSGYMSLYGHNDRLMKKEGDWVLTDEEIARVGDTGGQDTSSLYFEVRLDGDPVNPDLWCSL
jgi:septal ring factor EnvC (AmiA/AmiB activator)